MFYWLLTTNDMFAHPCLLPAAAAVQHLHGHTRMLHEGPSTGPHPAGSRSRLARSILPPQTRCHGEHTEDYKQRFICTAFTSPVEQYRNTIIQDIHNQHFPKLSFKCIHKCLSYCAQQETNVGCHKTSLAEVIMVMTAN